MEEIQRLTVQRRLGGMLQYRLFDNEDWGASHGRFFRRRSWTQRTMDRRWVAKGRKGEAETTSVPPAKHRDAPVQG